MNWEKLVNSAAYFVWAFIVQAVVALGLLGKVPEDSNTWIMLLVGAFIAANGKATSSTRMSPVGYTRALTDAERRMAAHLPLDPGNP